MLGRRTTNRVPVLPFVLLLIAALLSFAALARQGLSTALPASPASTPLESRTLAFSPIDGQAAAGAAFEARVNGNRIAFEPHQVTFSIPTESAAQTLRLQYGGASDATRLVADQRLRGVLNAYAGSDAANWLSGIPTFGQLRYEQLYPGIDLTYEGIDGALKSTFHVAAGADPALINWQYTGAESVTVSPDGGLLVHLPDGSEFVEMAPVAWQQVNGRQVAVTAAYTLTGGQIGFALGSYDASLPLTIDPTIVWETTVGGYDFDHGTGIVVDGAGNSYVMARAYENNNDVLIVKLGADGTLLYTTYIQGNALDYAGGLTLDGNGDLYVVGWTDSTNFPTLNAMQPQKTNSQREGFIVKLSGQDGSLLYGSYFGASRSDEIRDVALNASGEIYVVGQTESTDFPTVNPIQSGLNLAQCFCEDLFVTKFSADAQTILYSTYLGGAFEEYADSIGLDDAGNIYIYGNTQSDDFPTQNAVQPNRGGVNQDVDSVIARISADGSQLDYSTYLGGENSETIGAMVVDGSGNAYVTGKTGSENYLTTAGAFQENFVGETCGGGAFDPLRNCTDDYVTKLNPDGSLAYSTYVAGSEDDTARDIAIDGSGQAHVIGYSNSNDFPLASTEGLGSWINVFKLNASGSDLIYSLAIASQSPNAGHGIAVDGAGDAYITGAQNTSDLYVAKIEDDGGVPPTEEPTVTPTDQPGDPTATPTPEPTATPAPSSGTVHVGDLDGGSRFTFRRFIWQARATITVHDGDDMPVTGAVVIGSWSDGLTGQCTTGADGTCQVASNATFRSTSSMTYTVELLGTQAGDTYQPADNHDPESDSDGTSITISRP